MDYQNFLKEFAIHPQYKAPRGTKLYAKSWVTEAVLRMLLNNLDAEVAENPAEFIVYGGTGQAVRNRVALEGIVKNLLELDENHSLLIQSGKAVGIVRSHPEAPRVLIANSNLVPAFSTWEEFNKLRDRGLTMYGQMTAGSWIYIGSQGIVQGTYETFVQCLKTHFKNSMAGKWIFSGGLGGMGGAQPLAATLAGASFLGVDISGERIQKRLDTKYIDVFAASIPEALQIIKNSCAEQKPLSVGVVANVIDVLDYLVKNNITPDILTDQTSAHDPMGGYVPHEMSLLEVKKLAQENPIELKARSLASMALHVDLMLKLKDRGATTFDYGNNLREFAKQGGCSRAFEIGGFVPLYIRPQFCAGRGPFRFVALSGAEQDIYTLDVALMNLFAQNKSLCHWLKMAREKISFQGLPARICWLGMGEREQAGLLINQLVREGRVEAPIVIGRDHLDCGSVASPFRETEAMRDGSDAISDWPLLNLMANACGGASWISFHHGGGVGIGFSQHAGMVVVADGSARADNCLKRVLYNDPALGVLRHVDAGYKEAESFLARLDGAV